MTIRDAPSGTNAIANAVETIRSALDRRTALWLVGLLNLQLLFVVSYYLFTDVTVTQPRYALYGLIWVNIGVLVLYRVRPPDGHDFRTRRRAVFIAASYFALLGFFGGIVGTGVPETVTGTRIAWLPPGWGPGLVYAGTRLTLVLTPAYLIGYAALSYLLYITVLEASGSVLGGIVGLFSCVSCTFPILAAIVSSLIGGTGFIAATALDASYGHSTLVFLITIGLLYWRPGFR